MSIRTAFIAAITAGIVLLPLAARSTTWNIRPDGMGDAPTIQAGIDSAGSGDVIMLASGIFTGPGNRGIDFKGKDVTVTSSEGPDQTIIDCGGSGRGFLFQTGEGPGSVLSGVTIRNGSAGNYGGAVYCSSASPRISGNVFRNNSAVSGGAIYCSASSATIENNQFISNNAFSRGGAIWCVNGSADLIADNEFALNDAVTGGGGVGCQESSPTITNNAFRENTAARGAGLYCVLDPAPSVWGNTFYLNVAGTGGGAVFCLGSSPDIRSNLFRANSAFFGGGVFCDDGSRPIIHSNTLDANSGATAGGGIYCTNLSHPSIRYTIITNSTAGEALAAVNQSRPPVECCDFFGNAGGDSLPAGAIDVGGNFIADPQYCGVPGSGNYYLQSDSPCAPGNHPAGVSCLLIGAFPVSCQTSRTESRSWGAIKEIYRD